MMKKIYTLTIKLFRKENLSPIISSHFEGDNNLLRKQDIGMIIAELELQKGFLLNSFKPDAESIKYDIKDEAESDEH